MLGLVEAVCGRRKSGRCPGGTCNEDSRRGEVDSSPLLTSRRCPKFQSVLCGLFVGGTLNVYAIAADNEKLPALFPSALPQRHPDSQDRSHKLLTVPFVARPLNHTSLHSPACVASLPGTTHSLAVSSSPCVPVRQTLPSRIRSTPAQTP